MKDLRDQFAALRAALDGMPESAPVCAQDTSKASDALVQAPKNESAPPVTRMNCRRPFKNGRRKSWRDATTTWVGVLAEKLKQKEA